MDEEVVREYVEQARSIIDDSPQMDEANTKAAVLRDFLDLLGWMIPTNTQLEYSVKAFGKTYKVDYALVLEGAPVAFLEAKGVDTALTDEHREQLAAYLKNEDVNLGILTNGEEYEFFRRQVVEGNVNVDLLATVRLQNLPDSVPLLRAFTKGAIQNDEWVKILNRINELKETRTELESRKEELADELTALLVNEVSDIISSHAEEQAKEMVDRLIQDIESEIDSDEDRPSVSSGDVDPSSTTSHEIPESDGYTIEFSDENGTLAVLSDGTQTEAMGKAVNYLLENHDLISGIEPLPYIPGRNKAVINDEPTSPHDEQAMRQYQELTDGYYLDTHMNKDRKRDLIRELAAKCGLEVELYGEW